MDNSSWPEGITMTGHVSVTRYATHCRVCFKKLEPGDYHFYHFDIGIICPSCEYKRRRQEKVTY